MKVSITNASGTKDFENLQTILIGDSSDCDFFDETLKNCIIKLVYSQKYNNYVMINSSDCKDLLFNNKPFSKVLVSQKFSLKKINSSSEIEITIMSEKSAGGEQMQNNNIKYNNNIPNNVSSTGDVFDSDIEKQRISIIKEIGFKILDLKGNLKSAGITSFILNAAILILSVVSSFGITNFLLGFSIENNTKTLNLTTNFGFLICVTLILVANSMILKQGIYSILEFNQAKRLGDSDIAQKSIVGVSSIFLFIVYVMNLFYYKDIPGFGPASFFIAILFVGALASVTIASGYFKFQIKNYKQQLQSCEYRPDFESVMKNYRILINKYVNKLSVNKINNIKSNLVNNQLKMVLETFVGILTAPFLAYGVSNTLAGCFPEAANWVRISGLRFSPIFLVLATFLIIFAFFSFVRAFSVGKQIKGSEIIKFDGFHDYTSHGVTVLGLDSMRSLEREKNITMAIACFIILIEFTMNVSYFITEIGGDIQGMFLSFVTALVPTALLIAETHMLSSTMYKINNYSELLANLD